MRRLMRFGKGFLNSIEQAAASVGAAACYLYSKTPSFTGVEKLIAMDKNLLAHYNKSRFADRN